MTGSLPRGMLLDGDLSSCGHHSSYSSQKFTELHDSNGDEMGCTNPQTLVSSDPISCEVRDVLSHICILKIFTEDQDLGRRC